MINDTIAAISTPHGRGGIAVIRVSGENALDISSKVFRPASGRELSSCSSNSAVHGYIYYKGSRIDDGIAVIYRAPRSFTGEDTVELSCHGGILLTQTVLTAVLTAGAVMAGPGEFTRRAFIAGKLGLTQAEAVIGLIDAQSEEQLRLNAALASGALSRRLDELRADITALLSSIYAYIDFPDEDMTDIPPDELARRLRDISARLALLSDSCSIGADITQGILTVIAGQPNTGKSSLLNALLGRDRAIVTGIAGTTRDTIEENLTVGRVLLRICDTAGIRAPSDEAEKLGVERAKKLTEEARLILAVFDGSTEPDDETFALCERLSEAEKKGQAVIALFNKADLPRSEGCIILMKRFSRPIALSCKTGEGLDSLRGMINELFDRGEIDFNENAVLVNTRQRAAVENARECIENALRALDASMPQDIAGLELEHACTFLAGADGRLVAQDICDAIFANFCVGK